MWIAVQCPDHTPLLPECIVEWKSCIGTRLNRKININELFWLPLRMPELSCQHPGTISAFLDRVTPKFNQPGRKTAEFSIVFEKDFPQQNFLLIRGLLSTAGGNLQFRNGETGYSIRSWVQTSCSHSVVTEAFHTSLILGQPRQQLTKNWGDDLLSAATMNRRRSICGLQIMRKCEGILHHNYAHAIHANDVAITHRRAPWMESRLLHWPVGSLFWNATWEQGEQFCMNFVLTHSTHTHTCTD